MTRTHLLLTGLAGLLVVAVGMGCRQTEPRTTTISPGASDEAALHAIQSEELKSLMRQIQALDVEFMPQELDSVREREVYLENSAATALAMAQAASRLPEIITRVSMDESEREVFLVYADRLRRQSEDLGTQAQRGDEYGVRSSMSAIASTCVACHALFRDTQQR
jgi:cytochrome c556